jgi:AbrB family looped-hinge helix DNA binding protein
MAKVDSKGRIVLPQEIRERLGITPGTEVEIREDDGRAVVEPEDDPDQVIDRMERLVEAAAERREETTPLDEEADPIAQKHRKAVRSGAEGSEAERNSAKRNYDE